MTYYSTELVASIVDHIEPSAAMDEARWMSRRAAYPSLEGLAEIIHFAKYFDEPIQHGYLHAGWSAHLKKH